MASIFDRILQQFNPKWPEPTASIDVVAIMDAKARDYQARYGQKLDWRHSLEDTMKALGLGDDAQDRIALADHLKCPDRYAPGSAAANEWTRKALLGSIREHGGTVPDELL